MFLGEYVHSIDSKGRLTIPAKFRGELGTGLVVTRGMDRCLVVYPMRAWRQLTERASQLPMTDRTARDFRRLIFANATDTVPDSQGRINIPQPLLDYAGLDSQAVIAGCDSYIELWSPEIWTGVRTRVEESDDDIERWAALGI
ncbi:MAG: division/cell wall cluster transcriptional repressor MraZ [Anaerolineae bacterium]|jgi:MraZ protein